jgi:hypothetical protein
MFSVHTYTNNNLFCHSGDSNRSTRGAVTFSNIAQRSRAEIWVSGQRIIVSRHAGNSQERMINTQHYNTMIHRSTLVMSRSSC